MIILGCIFSILVPWIQADTDAHCVMRGNCGADKLTLLPRPCLYNGSPILLTDSDAIGVLKNMCPDLVKRSNTTVCCDAEQVDVLNKQLAALASIFKQCPACYHNLANLFCHLACSPTQSSYLKVTASSKNSVDELTYYITEDFASGLFDSCKNVKLFSTSIPAIQICCGTHSTDCTPHLWLDYMGSHDPSPYQINFQYVSNATVNNPAFIPMGATVIPCSEPVSAGGEACVSTDCPSSTRPPPPPPETNGHCVMRGNCGVDDLTGLPKPCVYNGSSVPLTDPDAISVIKDKCPDLVTERNISLCCDAGQIDIVNAQLAALESLFGRCPSCFHNLANLFCQQICSPSQSLYLKVTQSSNNSVDELQYYITEDFVSGLFDSCKNVKLATTTTPAIEICCGVHMSNCTPHLWLDYMGSHDPSSYQINFQYVSNAMENQFHPMNATIIPCSEPVTAGGEACSRTDCPSSPRPPPPPPDNNGHCVMRGNCDVDDLTGLPKPCVYNGSSTLLTDPNIIRMFKDMCPDLYIGPNSSVCCDAGQIDILNMQLSYLEELFKRCPPCYHNLANLFCHLVCSPTQSLYLKVTGSSNKSVDGLSYYIAEDFVRGLFDSCKNVKLATTTASAIQVACGEHGADCTPHLWLDYMGSHDPSSYQINFHYVSNANENGFHPMNATIIPCSEAVKAGDIACSYIDCPLSTRPPPPPDTYGHCVMRGNCDVDDLTSLPKPCVYNGSSSTLTDPDAISVLKDLCPDLVTGSNISACCDAGQVDVLNSQFAALAALFKRCPSCYRNLANLMCQLVCSPIQSLHLKVTDSSNKSVDKLSYYITEDFVSGLFDSCKNVKLGSTTTPAIQIACGAHGTDCNPHLWLDYIGSHDPSPYHINFHYVSNTTANNSTLHPMNATVIPCTQAVSDDEISCLPVDCPRYPKPIDPLLYY